jgi:fatty acid desaturase
MQTLTMIETPGDYRMLASQMREAGLLQRHPGRYLVRVGLIVASLAGGWVALFKVGNTWNSLPVAAFLAVVFTQLAFVGHDAGHQQIFGSRRANNAIGLVVANALTGLSFGWWVPKHNAHHLHPNVIGQDPDIAAGVLALSFTTDIARSRRGARRMLTRYQAWLFFPLLMLEGAGLHISGIESVMRRHDRPAAVEGVLMAMHSAFYLMAVFLVLSPLRALTFIAVQQGLFGLYLGCSFAPNHKGMPVLEDDSDLGFARRQIITARNVAGGRFISFMLGGLNYQIEHHLFPTMPRCNLPRAREIVRRFCTESGIGYREDRLVGSYREAVRYLNFVGSG